MVVCLRDFTKLFTKVSKDFFFVLKMLYEQRSVLRIKENNMNDDNDDELGTDAAHIWNNNLRGTSFCVHGFAVCQWQEKLTPQYFRDFLSCMASVWNSAERNVFYLLISNRTEAAVLICTIVAFELKPLIIEGISIFWNRSYCYIYTAGVAQKKILCLAK